MYFIPPPLYPQVVVVTNHGYNVRFHLQTNFTPTNLTPTNQLYHFLLHEDVKLVGIKAVGMKVRWCVYSKVTLTGKGEQNLRLSDRFYSSGINFR